MKADRLHRDGWLSGLLRYFSRMLKPHGRQAELEKRSSLRKGVKAMKENSGFNSGQGDLFPQHKEHTWSMSKNEFAPRQCEQPWKVGVFVDVQNLYLCIKSVFNQAKLNYRALRDFLTQNGVIVKMTAFTCYDPDNRSQLDFIHALAVMGYRVVAKPLKRLPDGTVKASMDMEMAIEIMSSAPYLDEIILVTGDGDFAPLVDQLARMGKVVKVIGPDRLTSPELIRACDAFINITQIDGILDI